MKLFVSFTRLLHAIAAESVSQEDLNTGLYFFGCVRSHAFDPAADGAFDERTTLKEKGQPAHEKLVEALRRAESEGRCRWYRPTANQNLPAYEELDFLLTANGPKALSTPERRLYAEQHYSYPSVRDYMLEVNGPGVEVLF